jgi:hypothetical protein
MAETKYDPNKPIPAVNTTDRAEHDKAMAAKATADKEAADKVAKEAAESAPTPTQEEADLMKQVALGEEVPEGTPQAKKREAKAEPADASYKTR